MKFKCNSTTSASMSSHTNESTRLCTLEAVDSYSSSITSGVVSISTDITNGALATKIYYCPICHEKLLWDKKYLADGNQLGSAVGTFTMLNDDGKTEATITDQDGVDNLEGQGGDHQDQLEILPEYGQPRYRYKKTEWTSTTETEEQKNSISWKDPKTGYVYYGTKAMNNIERGIYEANRKYTFRELQTKNLATALMKLRMNKDTSIAMWGDSVFAGFWYLLDEEHQDIYEDDNFTDDYGNKYTGFQKCKKSIPEVMVETLNKVYGNDKITMSRLVWNGVTVSNNKKPNGTPVDYSIFSHWRASKKDFAVMNFGINDAIGGHIPINYLGNVSAFIEGYKALIERELENGTAVIVISPFRLCTINIEKDIKADIDDRTIVDVYEQSLYSLCQEYGIPFIDGSLMLKNFDNEMYLDLSHLTPVGNESVGKRLASIFIGQNPLRPLTVHHNTYLSVMHQYSNCKLTGTANFSYSDDSPNIKTGVSMIMEQKPSDDEDSSSDSDNDIDSEIDGSEDSSDSEGEVETRTAKEEPNIIITKSTGAIQCELKANEDSILWSFYTENDGMVVIPSFKNDSSAGSVEMELDFGANQGSWANYWNFAGSAASIDRDHKEAHTVEYDINDLADKKFGYHMIDATHKKAIKIVNEGWHTVRLKAKGLVAEESIKVYGLTFMDMKEFNNAVK